MDVAICGMGSAHPPGFHVEPAFSFEACGLRTANAQDRAAGSRRLRVTVAFRPVRPVRVMQRAACACPFVRLGKGEYPSADPKRNRQRTAFQGTLARSSEAQGRDCRLPKPVSLDQPQRKIVGRRLDR